MPKLKNSYATFWVIFKQCALIQGFAFKIENIHSNELAKKN